MVLDNKQVLLNTYEAEKSRYDYLRTNAERIIIELLKKEDIIYSSVTSRLKDSNSLSKKIDSKYTKDKLYEKLQDITDLTGIRIITYYSDDVDKVSKIIENEFIVDHENSIDKRKSLDPDRFGYLSLHYVVEFSNNRVSLPEYSNLRGIKFEVQIRSILQHTWAEIEHDLGYKSDLEVPVEIKRDFSRLAGLLELADKEFFSIKDRLIKYAEAVESTLQENNDTSAKNILLDAVSLRAFIANNNALKSLNSDIAKVAKAEEIVETSNESISGILRELLWLDIKNVEDLMRLISERKHKAYELAKNLVPEQERIPDAYGLRYLCYAELLTNYDHDYVVSYLNDNNIGPKESSARLADVLIKQLPQSPDK